VNKVKTTSNTVYLVGHKCICNNDAVPSSMWELKPA